MNFDCVYNIINDEEKRNVVTALIKEIEIYRNDESEYPLKRIGLNFPVFKDGGEVTELLWDKGNTVETVIVLIKTIQSSVLYISNRIRQTIYFDIRAENCMRKCTKKVKHVPDSRKSFPAPLRPTKNEDPVRIEIRGIRLTETPFVFHRFKQIIYINMRAHVLVY